jgi:subfamily B ATP-binding cassette protein MsbA
MSDKSDSYQSYRRLLTYATPYWKVFIIAIIGMIAVALTETALAAYMKPLI